MLRSPVRSQRMSGMSDETTVFLIRHGATEHNLCVPVRLQGNAVNGPLAAVGRQQALALADVLSSLQISAIYSSQMIRARQTAEIVAAPHTLAPIPLDDLHEIAVGQWEGLTWAEIQERYPEHFQAFFDDPVNVPYLGGECYRDVLARARPVFHELVTRHRGQSIVIVTHNVVNRVLVADCLGLPLERAKFLHQSNCCINEIRCRPGITDVRSVNNDSHVWRWTRANSSSINGPTGNVSKKAD